MRLKEEFITHQSGDEHIMVSIGDFNGLVKSNKTGAYIIEMLKSDTSVSKIIDSMVENYDASREVITSDVYRVLDALDSIGALEK